jgi:CRP-like cAMP-binding protein
MEPLSENGRRKTRRAPLERTQEAPWRRRDGCRWSQPGIFSTAIMFIVAGKGRKYAAPATAAEPEGDGSMPMVDLEAVFERLSAFPILVFEHGDVVLAEGSTTGRLLFLIQGAVDVVKDQWQIAHVVEPGAVFGDMAALRGQPHSADVIAAQPSSFFVIDNAATFLKNEPLIALYVAVIQSGRLDAVNRHLIDARRQLAATGQQNTMFNAVLDRIGSALHARI